MTEGIAAIQAALPDYSVQHELGRGGMGVVYLGQHRQLDRRVAIKELPAVFARDIAVRERFVTEAKVLAGLGHPHIVPVFDYVEREGTCLLVMEALGGGTVWDRFTTSGLTMPQACAIVLATCSGLAHAHATGVLHRDIKPENLMFTDDSSLKVTDFGIAKVISGAQTMATVDGSVLGTPAYMAPEQAEGATVGAPADIYATGTMLYELLSGNLPFPGGESPMSTLVERVTKDPPPLGQVAPLVPTPLVGVTMKAIAREADHRFQTAEEFGVALGQAAVDTWGEEWLTTSGVLVQGSEPITVAARTTRSNTATIDPAINPLEVVEPVQSAPSATGPTLVPGQALVPAELIRPEAESHESGFDPDELAAEDLVQVSEVLRPPAVPWPQILVGLVLTVLALALALRGSDPEPQQDPALGSATLAGQPLLGSVPIQVDFGEDVAIDGVEGFDGNTVEVQLRPFGVGAMSLGPEDLAGGSASVSSPLAQWVLAGTTDAAFIVSDAEGKAVSESEVTLEGTNPWFLTAAAVGGIIVLLFGLSFVESNLRLLGRGRLRIGSLVGAAIGGGLSGGVLPVLASTILRVHSSLNTIVICAALVALAAIALGLARVRFGRRRRIKYRSKASTSRRG